MSERSRIEPGRLASEARVAVRGLVRRPIFALTAVVSLALGIGLNAAVFTMFDALIRRPYPVREGEDLVNIYQSIRQGGEQKFEGYPNLVSYPEYRRYKAGAKSFANLAAYRSAPGALNGTPAIPIQVGIASCDFFSTLRVRPQLGRVFVESDCRRGDPSPAVVLSNQLWRTQFGAMPSVLGRSIRVRGVALTVVGVAEPGFAGIGWSKDALWIPVVMHPVVFADRASQSLDDERLGWLWMVGRLRPGVDRDMAQAELMVVGQQASAGDPNHVTTVSVTRGSLFSEPETRKRGIQLSIALFAASAVVILLVCVNLLSLTGARVLTRHRETAIRHALGATRKILIGQLMLESVVLGLLGGGVALSVTSVLLRLVAIADRSGVLAQASLSVSPSTVGYVVAVSVVCSVLFGLLPAFRATQFALAASLRSAPGAGGDARSQWGSRVIVTAQIAGCYLLLGVGAVFLRAIEQANSLDLGLRTEGVMLVSLGTRELGLDPVRARAAYDELSTRLSAMGGIEGVAMTDRLPFGSVNTADVETVDGGATTWAVRQRVSPEYFRVLGIPVLAGRPLIGADQHASGDRPVVVSKAMAGMLWPTSDAVGQRLRLRRAGADGASFTVVGVAENGRSVSVGEGDPAILYEYLGQGDIARATMLVKTSTARVDMTHDLLLDISRAIDPALPASVGSMRDRVGLALAPARLVASIASGLGLLAALLAATGIYGVVNFNAVQRTPEFGVRMALGASASHILWLAARQGLFSVLVGLVAGAVMAAAGVRLVQSVVFNVAAMDLRILSAMTAVVIALSSAAILIPAARMLRGDPTRALRSIG